MPRRRWAPRGCRCLWRSLRGSRPGCRRSRSCWKSRISRMSLRSYSAQAHLLRTSQHQFVLPRILRPSDKETDWSEQVLQQAASRANCCTSRRSSSRANWATRANWSAHNGRGWGGPGRQCRSAGLDGSCSAVDISPASWLGATRERGAQGTLLLLPRRDENVAVGAPRNVTENGTGAGAIAGARAGDDRCE